MRYTLTIALLVLALLGVQRSWLGGAADAEPRRDGAPSCNEQCYAAKSRAYQRCRDISPSQREERTRCFRRADSALNSCLARCPR